MSALDDFRRKLQELRDLRDLIMGTTGTDPAGEELFNEKPAPVDAVFEAAIKDWQRLNPPKTK